MINKARIVENSKKALQMKIVKEIEVKRLIERKRKGNNENFG